MSKVIVVILMALFAAACGGAAGYSITAPPEPSFPFAAGTTWTYRQTDTPPAGPPQVGDLTLVYRGTTTYRGTVYHYEETTAALAPGVITRNYFTWTGGVPRRAAIVSTSASGVIEVVFSDTFATMGVTESRAGTAQVFIGGAAMVTVPWTASSSSAGTVSVTVPAGTFTTTRWNTSVTISDLATTGSVYGVGTVVAVRTDSTQTLSGVPQGTALVELTAGSVPSGMSAAQAAPGVQGGLHPFVLNVRQLRKRTN